MKIRSDITLDLLCGDDITDVCAEALLVANLLGTTVKFCFNGVELVVTKDSRVSHMVWSYNNKLKENS